MSPNSPSHSKSSHKPASNPSYQREDSSSSSSYVGNRVYSRVHRPSNLQPAYRRPQPGQGYDMSWLFEAANANGPPKELKSQKVKTAERPMYSPADAVRNDHRASGTYASQEGEEEGVDITEAPRPRRLGEVVAPASPYAAAPAPSPVPRPKREPRQRVKSSRARDLRLDTRTTEETWIPMEELTPSGEPKTPIRSLTKKGKGKGNARRADHWDDVEF